MTTTVTPRFGITQWGAGTDPFTRTQMNADNGQIELLAAIDIQANLAARPVAGESGRYFYAQDTGDLYRDNGTSWLLIWPGAGAPSAQAPGDSLVTGTSRLWAAADHKHSLPPWGGTPAAGSVGSAGAAGSSSSFARGDHSHPWPDGGSGSAQSPGDAQSAGSASTISRSDHKHGLPAWASSVIDLNYAAGVGGVANTFARGDHRHALPGSVARTDQSNGWTATQDFPDVTVGGQSLAQGVATFGSVDTFNGSGGATEAAIGAIHFAPVRGRTYKFVFRGSFIRSDNGADTAIVRLRIDGTGVAGTAVVQDEVPLSTTFLGAPEDITWYFQGAPGTDLTPANGALPTLAGGTAHTFTVSVTKVSGSTSSPKYVIANSAQFVVEDLGG